MDILQNFLTTGFFYTIIRVSTPLIFASLSSLIARKGGVTNITIDSTMIMSALTGVLVSAYTKNIWLALVCGMAVGVVMGIFRVFPYHDEYQHDTDRRGHQHLYLRGRRNDPVCLYRG